MDTFKYVPENNIIKGLKQLSDAAFESIYNKIYTFAMKENTIEIDFREINWFDLWSLIQLLFLLGNKKIQNKKKYLILISPHAFPEETTYNQKEEREKIKARLRFLFNTGFLDRVLELKVEILLQFDARPNYFKKVTLIDIENIVNEEIDVSYVSDSRKFIIPITPIEQLKLKEKREELFERAEEIFESYQSEAIVQEAGLGDCLLSELVQNVRDHGGKEGYISLCAIPGLNKFKLKDSVRYNRGRKARENHRLGDFKLYFERQLENAYFELIVADKGIGIVESIRQDERMPQILREKGDSPKECHELVKYSLRPDTSRFSIHQREERNYSEFTGLGAVRYVLSMNDAYLLIREMKSRHIFGPDILDDGSYYDDVRLEKYEEFRKLPSINGVSVISLIPIKGHGYNPIGIPNEKYNAIVNPEIDQINLEKYLLYRVNAPPDVHLTFLDNKISRTWKSIENSIIRNKKNYQGVFVDVRNASFEKNHFWPGLVRVRKTCTKKGIPLFLFGLDYRKSWRIEEFVTLDNKKISNQEDWLLVAFGDDRTFYSFGIWGNESVNRNDVSKKIAKVFRKDASPDQWLEFLLKKSNYFTDSHGISSHLEVRTLIESYRSLQAKLIEKEILEKRGAWVTDRKILLSNGHEISSYLCIHSLNQMRDIHLDLSRLIRLIANEFEFNFVISVGVVFHPIARLISRDISQPNGRNTKRSELNYYVHHDYFSFNHGETVSPIIKKEAKVLILVDGLRKGDHVTEAIEHIEDCEAKVVAVVSLFDFTKKGVSEQLKNRTKLKDIPKRSLLRVPILDAVPKKEIELIESPFTRSLFSADEKKINHWSVFLNKGQSYRYIEENGLILKGHSTFINQHFARTISLPFVLNSSSMVNLDLIDRTKRLIQSEEINCIIFPDHSSILRLVENMEGLLIKLDIETVMCRFSVWPDGVSGYELDEVGKKTLKYNKNKNILILEDEIYTGSSIRDMVALCFKNLGNRLNKLVIFSVINSMKQKHQSTLVGILKNNFKVEKEGDKNCINYPTIKLYSLMQFSLCTYWTKSSCPICQQIKEFRRQLARKLGFIEKDYAAKRIIQLKSHIMDQDYQARCTLKKLRKPLTVQHLTIGEPIHIMTQEGLELFCEEMYNKGNLAWLIERLNPEHRDKFCKEKEVILAIIEIISRDMGIVRRLRLQKEWFQNINYLLNKRSLQGEYLTKLMELLSVWPLHCLIKIWSNLLESLFSEKSEIFIECYPGAQLLMYEIDNRPEHKLKEKLLLLFDNKIQKIVEKKIDPNEYSGGVKQQIALCLRRASYYDRDAYKTLGSLVSEITYLFGSLDKNKISHRILSKGLSTLIDSETIETKKHLHVVQMCSHLGFALSLLTERDPKAFEEIKRHPDCLTLIDSIKKLQDLYPSEDAEEDSFGRNSKIKKIASTIYKILYKDDGQRTLRKVIIDYLENYRYSLQHLFSKFEELVSSEVKVFIQYYPSRICEEFKNLFIVLNEETFKLTFEEVLRNLKKAKKHLLEKREPKGQQSLFIDNGKELKVRDEELDFHIDINISTNIDSVHILIESPCNYEDFQKINSGIGGIGLNQIKTFMGWLGNNYRDPEFNAKNEVLSQEICLRRIHR